MAYKKVVLPEILEKVAKCESGLRQFNKDGTVHRGEQNNKDVGYLQINEKYWLDKSKKLGYNIYTLNGNKQMGLWIYQHYGTSPWNWSRGCWGV